MASIQAAEQDAQRDSLPNSRVELPFIAELNPAQRGEVNRQGASKLARKKDGAYTVIQRGHCKGVTLVSTKKGSGYESSPAQDVRTSACQRDPQIRCE